MKSGRGNLNPPPCSPGKGGWQGDCFVACGSSQRREGYILMKRFSSEKGQILPMVLIALALGTLLVSPFLTRASTSLITSGKYTGAIFDQNAADAGVEHAIWRLTDGDLVNGLPSSPYSYQLPVTINNIAPNVTVTAPGAITDTVFGPLEFDPVNGFEPDIVHVSGDIYAIAYRGITTTAGVLKTVSISSGGSISAGSSLTFHATGNEPDIIHVSGDIYAIAYRGPDNDGWLRTVSISSNGQTLSLINFYEFDASNGYTPSIIHVSGDIYAIAYRGITTTAGVLKTVSISSGGSISAKTSLTFDATGYEPDIVQVSGNTYAIAYRGPGNDGWLRTVSILPDGQTLSLVGSYEFDTADGNTPAVIYVAGDVFAIAYRGNASDGFLTAIRVALHQIQSTAGADVITAVVRFEEATVNVVSWQVQ